MSDFDERRISRDHHGRFSPRPARPPAVTLESATAPAQPPPRTGRHTAPESRSQGRARPRTPATWRAGHELEALRAAQVRLDSRDERLRRALAERDLQRAGVASALVSVDWDGNVEVSHVETEPGRQADAEALTRRLAQSVTVDLPGQIGGPGAGTARAADALTTSTGRPRRVAASDRVAAAQASFEASRQRLQDQTRRAVTALCLEAERQHLQYLDVVDEGVYTPDGQPLRVETPDPARLDDLADEYVDGLPEVYRTDDGMRIEVASHLEASDVQVPGQWFIRL